MRGLYVHIPFCAQKCSYCDFYSIETTSLVERFVEALTREIPLRAGRLDAEQRRADTVFFGGGTPSLLSARQFERIADVLRKNFDIAPEAEWTVECNPGTVAVESLRAYRASGANRLSFGVQSFFEDDLRFLSRIHSAREAFEAVEIAREAGFENINLDLMFALPNQTLERWRQNLDAAASLGVEHISAYSLIFEEGTPLNAMRLRGEVRPSDEETDAAMYELAMETLAEAGYEQYEVSNFARAGKECRHNLVYWQGEEYVAFGASAHGFLLERASAGGESFGERYWNARSVKRYCEALESGALPVAGSERLGRAERAAERAFLELRARGVRLREFERDFGVNIERALPAFVERCEAAGLFERRDGRLALTRRGYALCDEITADLLAALEKR